MPMEPTPPRGPTPSSQIEEKCDHGDPAEPYTHHHQAWAERTGRARKREGDGSRLPARFDCSRYLMSGNVPGEREGSRAPTSPHRPQSVGRGPAPRRMWRRDGVSSLGGRQSIGHLLFLSATCMTACYTVAIRHARIDGLHAVAIAAVVSLLVYLPVYLAFFENGLFNVPLADLAFQALYQGVLTATVSLSLYGPASASWAHRMLLPSLPSGRSWRR